MGYSPWDRKESDTIEYWGTLAAVKLKRSGGGRASRAEGL